MLLTHGVRFLATVALSPVMMSTTDSVTKFPTSATPPLDVAMAQLDALRDADIEKVYSLFSRARRAIFADYGRAQSCPPPPRVLHRRVRAALRESCPGLLGHSSATILSALQLEEKNKGRLPHWRCRVRVHADPETGQPGGYYAMTLVRQHDPPPPVRERSTPTMAMDPRNADRFDGFEGCWFVWSIVPDNGGGGDGEDYDGSPRGGAEKPLPALA